VPGNPVSSEALRVLSDPVGHDPQSTFVSKSLLKFAEDNEVNLVACLPDEVVTSLARSAFADRSSGESFKALAHANVKCGLSDGWLTLTPSDRLKALDAQMNRAATRPLLSASAARGYSRLHEIAKFWLNLGNYPSLECFAVKTLRIIDPFAWQDLQSTAFNNGSLLQFLGTLPESSLNGQRAELSFLMGTMTQPQKGCLERLIYGASAQAPMLGEGVMMMVGTSIGGGPGHGLPKAGLGDEPTEVLPNGLPGDGILSIKLEQKEVVRAEVKGKRGGPFLTAGQYGALESMRTDKNLSEMNEKMPQYDLFTPGSSFQITVNAKYLPKVTRQSAYTDAWTLQGAKTVGMQGLDPKFLEAAKKAQEEMMSHRFRIGGEVPPSR
ncbi:MAG: hypothetical protein JNM34_04190, partial [Chthonomonadaceae bacterium]|nr:hypothetical protein [Chthonomonadaceae bacterium]